ncbi:MAG: hypothetical protein JJ979_19310 [Roseibium sp.]|nr:hypothetical protein [Roseibium sp.]
MQLKSDWKRIIQRAWSVRLIVLAGVFSGAEVAMPYLGEVFEPGLMAGLSAVATAGAFMTRLLAQKEFKK